MPTKNVIKEYVPNSYYHIYSRGGNKQKLFLEDADYKYFLKLFERYLSSEPVLNKADGVYPNFFDDVEVLSYCIMPNHFHLLLFQNGPQDLTEFMRCLMTSYSLYFNLKYKHTGPVFESRYKAVRIDREDYLLHITRYIHLNPKRWQRYKYSSLKYYRDGCAPRWLDASQILSMFSSVQEYMDFLDDYEKVYDELNKI